MMTVTTTWTAYLVVSIQVGGARRGAGGRRGSWAVGVAAVGTKGDLDAARLVGNGFSVDVIPLEAMSVMNE